MSENKLFEWYYFDVHCDNGEDVVFTLHVKPFMSAFAISIFDFFIYRDGRRIEHSYFALPREQAQRSDDGSRLIYTADNSIVRVDDRIQVRVQDAQITLDLNLENECPFKRPLELDLLPKSGPGQSFKWKVFAPLARARGTLRIADKEYILNGRAYHDYNCGTVNLFDTLQGWTWGKTYRDGKLEVRGKITDRNGMQKLVGFEAGTSSWCLFPERQEPAASFDEIPAGARIDDIALYVAPAAKRNNRRRNAGREVLMHLISEKQVFNKFYQQLCNTRYTRYREQPDDALAFYEQIVFD